MPTGTRCWFGLDRGTSLTGLNGTNPFALGVTQFHWDEHDRTFDWKTVSIDEYPDCRRGRLPQYRGRDGYLRRSQGVREERRQAAHPGRGQRPAHHAARSDRSITASWLPHGHKSDFEKQQEFYRLFRTPGAGHCSVPNAFPQLIDWVENGVAPEQIINSTHGRRRSSHASPLRVPADCHL